MKPRAKKIITQIFVAVVCVIVLFSAAPPCFAASGNEGKDDTDTIKVGFFAFDGYHMQTGNEKDGYIRSGYGYEMLMHLAGYGGFNYEFVGYDKSWSEMQEMLANGEIDILSSAQKTPEREARFDFTSTNIGMSSVILTVKDSDKTYAEADYENWNGMRVGMLEGSSRNDDFAKYASENGFSFTPVYYGDTEEMIADLHSNNPNKKIDSILTSDLRKIEHERIIAQFASSPFYIMVQKGNTDLLARLNSSISQLDICEPGLRTKLMNKYYSSENSDSISFTAEEKAYLEKMQNQEITALINPDREPYSYFENGELKGICYDIAQKIIDVSGLNIKFLDIENPDEYYKAVESNKADIRFVLFNSYNQAEKENLWVTAPFITVPMASLYVEGNNDIKSIAEPISQDIAGDYEVMLKELGLGNNVTIYPTIDETVNNVLSGKCDVSYLPIDIATSAVRKDVTNRLTSDELFGNETSYTIAIKDNNDEVLFSILNKAATSITDSQVDAVRQKYISNLERPNSFKGFFYDYPILAFLGIGIVLGMVILLIIFIFSAKRRRREKEYLRKEQEQNEALKDALNAAEKADVAKSRFLSSVSHEMRTPLNAIIGFNELAKDAEDTEKMASYLASSEVASKQLLSVINDVLDMSSIESGKLKISHSRFNLKLLLSSITNIYGLQCKHKGIEFETKITTPLDDWIIGDELRLNQIFMNLLGNSVKFTDSGHIWLSISETYSDDKTIYLRFSISDTGCGMSDEMKGRLFKPFEQENASVARKHGGSGLGLSIVNNLVALMGGTIKVETQQGVGTTFTVDLPFTRSVTDELAELPNKVKKIRVLAIDDEESEREYMSLVLKRMGVRFTCVKSGQDALTELGAAEKANDLYNVCLVDWRMNGMDGLETTAKIRESYGKDVVVIIVSAYDFQQAGESARGAGANLFLSKPIFQSSLFDLFMTLTDGKIAKPVEKISNLDFAGRRVLLAEDNILNQVVEENYLGKYNILVEIARDGREAVEMFTASRPGYYDAILMDVQMPEMDGFEATQAIRTSNHPEAKTIHIIAQTADAFTEDVARCLSAGMNDHVAKPISPKSLGNALRKAFADKQLQE